MKDGAKAQAGRPVRRQLRSSGGALRCLPYILVTLPVNGTQILLWTCPSPMSTCGLGGVYSTLSSGAPPNGLKPTGLSQLSGHSDWLRKEHVTRCKPTEMAILTQDFWETTFFPLILGPPNHFLSFSTRMPGLKWPQPLL